MPGRLLCRPVKSGAGNRKRKVNLWHLGFGDLLSERGSPSARVVPEWTLPLHSRRVDFLLIRREGKPDRDHEARSLRGLWPRLAGHAVVELKSPSRPLRASELIRLVACGALYHEQNYRDLGGPREVTLVLIVPRFTPTLVAEIKHMGWMLEPLEPGYAEIRGVMYTTYVVFTNEVAEAEDDDFLRIFSDLTLRTLEAHQWLETWFTEKDAMLDPKTKPEGYDELMQKLLGRLSPEERLRGLSNDEILRRIPPEERLHGLPPEERLRGLTHEQMVLAMPDEILRILPDDFIQSLPAQVQHAIRERLGRRG